MVLKTEISSELRNMVREVLREAVPSRLGAIESVRITSDSELQTFIARLLDPAVMAKVKSGKLHFTLGCTAAVASDVLTGVISEKTIDKNAGRGAIVLAPDAVLTPLARDRARKLGLKIERRR